MSDFGARVRSDSAMNSERRRFEWLDGDQRTEGQTVYERRRADRVKALAWQQDEKHEIAEGVGEGEDFARHAAFGAADGLACESPF